MRKGREKGGKEKRRRCISYCRYYSSFDDKHLYVQNKLTILTRSGWRDSDVSNTPSLGDQLANVVMSSKLSFGCDR